MPTTSDNSSNSLSLDAADPSTSDPASNVTAHTEDPLTVGHVTPESSIEPLDPSNDTNTELPAPVSACPAPAPQDSPPIGSDNPAVVLASPQKAAEAASMPATNRKPLDMYYTGPGEDYTLKIFNGVRSVRSSEHSRMTHD